jgi:hypothetical protein
MTTEIQTPIIREDDQGVPRFLGCILPEAGAPSYFADLAGIVPQVPRDQWTDVDLSDWLPPVLNQGSTPMCGGFSTAAAHTTAAALAGGGRKITDVLSPGWVYGYCQEPGGGILVRNALACLQDRGCPPVSVIGEFDTNVNNYNRRALDVAKLYKLTAAYQVKSFDDLASALMAGFVVEFGVLLGHAFTPDSRGVVPDAQLHLDGTDGGHAMFCYGLKRIDNRWYARVRNSWGETWGLKGSCYMPESYFRLQVPGYRWNNLDAFAIKGILSPLGVPSLQG